MAVQTTKFSQFTQVDLANPTNQVVGVSSSDGGTNFQAGFPVSWNSATRPSSPSPGTPLGYNTSLSQYEYWNGISWVQLSAGGSGTVGIGSINEIVYYPATGTAVSGLPTVDNGALVTDISGIPSMEVATGTGSPVKSNGCTLIFPNFVSPLADSIQFTSTRGVIGTTTNDNASAGSVGEFAESIILSGSAIPLTNNIVTDVTFIDLTAGDWDIWGNVLFYASEPIFQCAGWISQTSATVVDGSLLAALNIENMSSCGFTVPGLRKTLSGTTRIFLSCTVITSGSPGDITVGGGIYARRRR